MAPGWGSPDSRPWHQVLVPQQSSWLGAVPELTRQVGVRDQQGQDRPVKALRQDEQAHPAEDRLLCHPAEDRLLCHPAEDRLLRPAEDRLLGHPAGDRHHGQGDS